MTAKARDQHGRGAVGHGLLAMLGVMALAAAAEAAPVKPRAEVELTPHRAIYDMELEEARSSSAITALRGRLVFELRGAACEGYTVNMRFVSQMTQDDGRGLMSDIRTSSHEDGQGASFRFSSSQFLDQKLSEATLGEAKRASESLQVTLQKPTEQQVAFNGRILFPTQHSKFLIEQALDGVKVVESDIYDGSEKGVKQLRATAFIGAGQKAPAAATPPAEQPLKNSKLLADVASWPVSIAYFDANNKDETLPTFEMAFRLYQNGVSQDLLLDYGDFSIKGALREIEYLAPPACK